MDDVLDAALMSMRMGDLDSARDELMEVLRLNPQNVEAWELLAEVIDEPRKKMDCYRQVLRFEPANQNAALRLAELSGQRTAQPPANSHLIRQPAGGEPVRLPSVEQPAAQPADSSLRALPAQQTPIFPPEILQLISLLRENGPDILDLQVIEKFKSQGIDITITDEGVTIASEFRKVTIYAHEMRSLMGNLSWNQIITQSNERLRTQERRQCPKCQAMMSVSDARCPWCGTVIDAQPVPQVDEQAPKPVERRRCPKCEAVVEPQAVRCPWCGASL